MKKLLCMLLALMMALTVCLSFTACGGDDKTDDKDTAGDKDKGEDETVEITVPDGYTLYDNGDISFAYPEDWTKSEASGMVSFVSDESANINIVAEDKTDLYDDLTAEKYEELFVPYFEAAGMEISNLKVEQIKNNGLDVTVVTFDMTIEGISMQQSQYAVTGSEKTYVITVADTDSDSELAANVLATLAKA